MIDNAVHPADAESVEALVRAELVRGDMLVESVQPVLRHLLAVQGGTLFSDEVLARLRGMLGDLARGLLGTQPGQAATLPGSDMHEALVQALMDQHALLTHVHALALEWHLTERLQARVGLDPVVSPLLQSLVSSEDEGMQALAMTWLASQARWCQAQRRMALPFTELPGELLHVSLQALEGVVAEFSDGHARMNAARAEVRERYEEGGSRLGLATQIVMALGNGAGNALMIEYGGLGLFLTALSIRSGMARDALVQSTDEGQMPRFALALRAAGLGPDELARQLLVFHPGRSLGPAIDTLDVDTAASILAARD